MMNVTGLHHVRFGVVDLERTEAFATDFGLQRVQRDGRELYMCGAGEDAYYYVAEKRDHSSMLALAFSVASRADLDYAVAHHGATPIRELTGPGGGFVVTLQAPEGQRIDLVYGIAKHEPETLKPGLVLNFGHEKSRKNAVQNLRPKGPPQLMRLGHVGLYVKDFAACARWFHDVLGMLPSDQMYMNEKSNLVCGFFRLNRGAQPVDHHVVFLAQYGKTDLHHISFEVQDFEAQFMAHLWLKGRHWEPVWGVGRHTLGCHIFDVWMDPNGYRFETFTDTDLFDDKYQPGLHNVFENKVDVWCDDSPERYFGPMPK
jgi:catechol 2,3-dioxygenase-like lactoylglutathione lyase family enzyme